LLKATDEFKEVKIMMNNAKRIGFVGLLLSVAVVFSAATVVFGQDTEAKQPTAKTRNVSGGRDPFKKYEPPKVVLKRVAGEVVVPSIQERINIYKAQKQAAMNARMPAPKPTTALLLNEIQVIGITRTPRGYAAIVEASPIKLSYVIYPGEPFYDGQLVAIEDKTLIFRHETVYTDGRRVKNVESKLLRQPNQVNAMAATPSSSSDVPTAKP
jgi:hypothetical protein